METVYQACDGDTFECRAAAVEHETELFEDWLEALMSGRGGRPGPPLSTVVRHFNDSPELSCEADSFYGSPLDRLKTSLREYWDGTTDERSN